MSNPFSARFYEMVNCPVRSIKIIDNNLVGLQTRDNTIVKNHRNIIVLQVIKVFII